MTLRWEGGIQTYSNFRYDLSWRDPKRKMRNSIVTSNILASDASAWNDAKIAHFLWS